MTSSSAPGPRACIAATMGSLLMSGLSATRRRPLKMMDATPTCSGLSRAPSRVSSGGSAPSPGAGSSCTASCTSCAARPRGPGSGGGQGSSTLYPYTTPALLIADQLPRLAHALIAADGLKFDDTVRACLVARPHNVQLNIDLVVNVLPLVHLHAVDLGRLVPQVEPAPPGEAPSAPSAPPARPAAGPQPGGQMRGGQQRRSPVRQSRLTLQSSVAKCEVLRCAL